MRFIIEKKCKYDLTIPAEDSKASQIRRQEQGPEWYGGKHQTEIVIALDIEKTEIKMLTTLGFAAKDGGERCFGHGCP